MTHVNHLSVTEVDDLGLTDLLMLADTSKLFMEKRSEALGALAAMMG